MDEISIVGKGEMWSCVVNDKVDIDGSTELFASKTYFSSDINLAM
jgi:hypothetical protein